MNVISWVLQQNHSEHMISSSMPQLHATVLDIRFITTLRMAIFHSAGILHSSGSNKPDI